MSQDREVITPLNPSTFESKLNDAVGVKGFFARNMLIPGVKRSYNTDEYDYLEFEIPYKEGTEFPSRSIHLKRDTL